MAVALNVDAIGIANFLYQNNTARDEIVTRAREAVAAADRQAASGQAKTPAKGQGAAGAGSASAAADAASQPAATPSGDAGASKQKFDQASMTLDSLDLPIGWPAEVRCRTTGAQCAGHAALTVLGWLLTAFAATLGAPFWFDTLNRVMVIRSTVKPYEKSKPEASEDRQKP
jgi:hypothetical protein